MKNSFTIWIPIVLLSIFLGSCRARFYTPNRNPIPLFEEKGDVFIDASGNGYKYDLTLGYALTNNIGTYAGVAIASTDGRITDTIKDIKYKYTGEMLNLGLGYYINRDFSKMFRFEVFADYGMGNYKNKVSGSNNQYFNGNYHRIGRISGG